MDYLDGVQDLIETTTDPLAKDAPSVSVIVVSYARNEQLIDCLNSLRHQTLKDFEVILVDNGGNQRVQEQIQEHVVSYVGLKQNYGLSSARNVGIVLARAPLVVFLDDDLIAAPGLVEAHARAHKELDIVAMRGKCLAKTRTICNFLQFHYDLGTQVRPTVMNLAGNSSFSRDLLVTAGGFHPEFFGHEELELTYRLVTEHGIHRNRIVYYPEAVGYHDYCHSIRDYAKKRSRHDRMWNDLVREHPGIEDFVASYKGGGSLRPWSSLPRRMCGLAVRTAVNGAIDLASEAGLRRPAS